jgi:cephalosporin hydroxylase
MKRTAFPTEEEIKKLQPFILKSKHKNEKSLKKDALQWTRTAWENKMDYEISWFGIPIIQNPYDILLMQELIFKLKPDLIIETGIAHGGSLLFYASLFELLGKGKVIGVDIDIREHNKQLIEKHPFFKRVKMFEGSSTDEKILSKIRKLVKPTDVVLVLLDSDHTSDHVYAELNAYKNFVSKDSYIVVFDTFAPYLVGLKGAKDHFETDNAMNAVKRFVKKNNKEFVIDKSFNKFYVSSLPDGFLKRIEG